MAATYSVSTDNHITGRVLVTIAAMLDGDDISDEYGSDAISFFLDIAAEYTRGGEWANDWTGAAQWGIVLHQVDRLRENIRLLAEAESRPTDMGATAELA